MRKQLIIIAIFTILLSSCFTYSCPTYSKKPNKRVELEKQKDNI